MDAIHWRTMRLNRNINYDELYRNLFLNNKYYVYYIKDGYFDFFRNKR